MFGLNSDDLDAYIQAKKKQQADQLPSSELAGSVPTELDSNRVSPPQRLDDSNANELTNDYSTKPRLVSQLTDTTNTTPVLRNSLTDTTPVTTPVDSTPNTLGASMRTQDYLNPPSPLSVPSTAINNLGLLDTSGSQVTSRGGTVLQGSNPTAGVPDKPMGRGKAMLLGLLQGMGSQSGGGLGGLLGGAIAGAATGAASPDTIASINADQKLHKYYADRAQAVQYAQEQAKLNSTNADTMNKLNEPYFKNKEFDFKNSEYSRQLANDKFSHDTETSKLTESNRHNLADEQLSTTRNNLFSDRTKQQANTASMKQPPDYEKSLADQASVNAASTRKSRAQLEGEVFKYMQSVPEYNSNGKQLTKEDVTYNKYINSEFKRLVTEAQADNDRQVKDKETSERNRLRQTNTGASPTQPKGRLVPMYIPK